MTKKDDEYFQNSTKWWSSDNAYVDGEVKLRDHFHIIGKCKFSAYRDRDCNINVKNYDSNPIIQELGKVNLKINVIVNGLEKILELWHQ